MQYSIFDNHLTKCRCCFKPQGSIRVPLNNCINLLESIVGYKLNSDRQTTLYICLICSNKLKEFQQFMTKTRNLQDLYNKFLSGETTVKLENETEFRTTIVSRDVKHQIERVDVVEVPELLSDIKLEFDEDACRKLWNIQECWVRLERIETIRSDSSVAVELANPKISKILLPPLSQLKVFKSKAITVRRIQNKPKNEEQKKNILTISTSSIIDFEISNSQTEIAANVESSHPLKFPCQELGCIASFQFEECLKKHMQSHHQIIVSSIRLISY